MQEWAEIRAMKAVQRLSIKEIARRTGHSRNTIRAALRSPVPPTYGPRPKRPSKVDPFVWKICELLEDEPTLSGVRILEEISGLGYRGSGTILDDRLREIRPRYLPPPRSFQRTVYRPGELAQFDLCEPLREIPVGWDQSRRGYVVTVKLPYSRAFAGALVFSKEFAGIAWGMSRCLARLGALPSKLVWDREGAIAPKGQPTEPSRPSAASSRSAGSSSIRVTVRPRGRSSATTVSCIRTFEAGRRFANPLDFQAQLDDWCDRINARKHRSTRAVVCERLASERERMRALPAALPDTNRRFVIRVPAQPYLRFDRNDYSLDPRLVGRRVEVRASQSELVAVALDRGELACRHRRVFAGGLVFTDPAHQQALDELRGERKRRRREPEVEVRPLARYDALLPA